MWCFKPLVCAAVPCDCDLRVESSELEDVVGLGAFVHVNLVKIQCRRRRVQMYFAVSARGQENERVEERFRVCYLLTRLM